MRIAIAQMAMSGTCAENLQSVLDRLAEAEALGADLVLFPECATTGYHRRVPEQVSRLVVHRSLDQVRARCAALGISAVVGTPFYPSVVDERIWNAAVAIDETGGIRAICPKAGLTGSERGFFHAGAPRPVFTLGTLRCGVILCREVRDADSSRASLQGARLVFWPGVIAWNSGGGHPDNVVTREIASHFARTVNGYLVQCNWASSQNRPELEGMGGSLVVSPDGEVVHECPVDRAGISIVEVDPRPAEVPRTWAAT